MNHLDARILAQHLTATKAQNGQTNPKGERV
jgi:hypothetical protein